VNATNSYQGFLTHMGYGLTLTKQIHVQDCYSRLGAAGGIRAVLPYNDIPTQGTMHTLVNVNSTVTTTPKAAGFFNEMLARFKVELGPQN